MGMGSRRRQRGASVLESLVAFVIVAGGTVGIGHLQARLRIDADGARQRAEALRLGRAELEEARRAGTAAAAERETAPAFDGTRYLLAGQADAGAFAGATTATVRVQWNDRAGTAREVGLGAIVAAIEPALAGALALGAGAVTAAPRGAFGRAPAVPVEARDLGDGRSAWKPAEAASVAYVFDNASGAIVARCGVAASQPASALGSAELAACTRVHALLVSGTLRSAGEETLPTAALSLVLSGGRYPAEPECHAEARKTVRFVAGGSERIEAVALGTTPADVGAARWRETGDRFVAWQCAVVPRSDGAWSGRAVLADPTHRLCRFGSGAGEGAAWADVSGTRPGQALLAAAASQTCAAALAAWAERP